MRWWCSGNDRGEEVEEAMLTGAVEKEKSGSEVQRRGE